MAKLSETSVKARKLLSRYNAVSAYINNQTEKEWSKLEDFIISQLDFEKKLEISNDPELL